MINIEKITDDHFKSIVYISHPYNGLKDNEEKAANIIIKLQKQHPDYLFVSPIHSFSFAYDNVDYGTGLNMCLWLLEKCDEMWVFGDWSTSKGCNREIKYCEENKISIVFME